MRILGLSMSIWICPGPSRSVWVHLGLSGPSGSIQYSTSGLIGSLLMHFRFDWKSADALPVWLEVSWFTSGLTGSQQLHFRFDRKSADALPVWQEVSCCTSGLTGSQLLHFRSTSGPLIWIWLVFFNSNIFVIRYSIPPYKNKRKKERKKKEEKPRNNKPLDQESKRLKNVSLSRAYF